MKGKGDQGRRETTLKGRPRWLSLPEAIYLELTEKK